MTNCELRITKEDRTWGSPTFAILNSPFAIPPSPTLRCAKNGAPQKNGAPGALAIIVGMLTLLVLVAPASAHHILGLPHYSYKENYPQRPTLEYPATTGPYDILLTSYPGIPVPGEPANLAFYIKNRGTGKAYAESVAIRILQTSTFGDNVELLPSRSTQPFDNEHKCRFTFPADGEYIVELSLMVEGQVEIIPFLMIAGAPTATASIAVTGCVALVVCFIVLRAVQKKRRRRRGNWAPRRRLQSSPAGKPPAAHGAHGGAC